MIDSLMSNSDPVSWFFLIAGIGFGAGVIASFVSRTFSSSSF